MFKIFLLSSTCMFSAAAFGQHSTAPDFAAGIARIETGSGFASGFVVATDPKSKRFEIWTNGHAVGGVGSEVIVRLRTGTSRERTYRALVARKTFQGRIDYAKLVCYGDYTGKVFSICSACNSRSGNFTVGHPHGGRTYAVRLTDVPGFDYSSVMACFPAAIPGQSGSPVIGETGKVVGVVSLYFEDPQTRQIVGGYLPISDWVSGVVRSSSGGVGPFHPIPNASR